MEKKKRLKIFDPDEVMVIGKCTAEVRPRSDTVVPPSPLGYYNIPGFKCEHGVYIPCTSPNPDRAEFCSFCHPYVIQEKSSAKKAKPDGQVGANL